MLGKTLRFGGVDGDTVLLMGTVDGKLRADVATTHDGDIHSLPSFLEIRAISGKHLLQGRYKLVVVGGVPDSQAHILAATHFGGQILDK